MIGLSFVSVLFHPMRVEVRIVGVKMWFQASPMFCPLWLKGPPVLPAPPMAGIGRLGEAGRFLTSWL